MLGRVVSDTQLSGHTRLAHESQAHHSGGGEGVKERSTTADIYGGGGNPMIDRRDAVSVVNDGATANGIDDRDASPPR